jgi:diguanylate cyclase (GGDEF)-like protein
MSARPTDERPGGVRVQRQQAHLDAFGLFEAVQTERHLDAAAQLPGARRTAVDQGWPDVELVLAAAAVVHELTRVGVPERTQAAVDELVARAEQLAAPALTAVALGLRALVSSVAGESATSLADASRAVALLDDDSQPPLDRCLGYVVAAAAFNTLDLWELVDELYSLATGLESQCTVPALAPAIAVNRVLTRMEWAIALLEVSDDDAAATLFAQTADAVAPALALPLPRLWRHDVLACAEIARLLGPTAGHAVPDVDEVALRDLRDELAGHHDTEVLPVLEAAVALALHRAGRRPQAVAAASTLASARTPTAGARSFPLWARAHVVTGDGDGPAVLAQRAHAQLVSRLRWQSRTAVLAAARAQVATERRSAEHARLTRDVDTDPLTGLRNRRAFDLWLTGGRVADRPPGALLLIDVDDFKSVNDGFGHDRGDEVLRAVAATLEQAAGSGSLTLRLGGDEFAVLLDPVGLTPGRARERAARVQTALAHAPWGDIAAGLRVTASIGVAITAPAPHEPSDPRSTPDVADPVAMYRAADTALYAGKADGTGLHVARVGAEPIPLFYTEPVTAAIVATRPGAAAR